MSTTTARDVFVIDPWLHVACHASDYPVRAAAQLDNWTKENKRVLWKVDGQYGWWVANGKYEVALLSSPLELSPA